MSLIKVIIDMLKILVKYTTSLMLSQDTDTLTWKKIKT